jgi:mono/diheme cytochrome c family protein
MGKQYVMRFAMLLVLAIGSFIGLIAPVLAQDAPGDIASGRRIAESWCAACHQIDSQEPESIVGAPSFVAIAKLPSTTALALNVFLRTTHNVMPNYQLTRQEADDVVAFILSLKDK